MAIHYVACSRLMTLVGIRVSQNPTVPQLQ